MVKDFDVIAVSKIHFNVIFSRTGEVGGTCCRPLPGGEELRISRNRNGPECPSKSWWHQLRRFFGDSCQMRTHCVFGQIQASVRLRLGKLQISPEADCSKQDLFKCLNCGSCDGRLSLSIGWKTFPRRLIRRAIDLTGESCADSLIISSTSATISARLIPRISASCFCSL